MEREVGPDPEREAVVLEAGEEAAEQVQESVAGLRLRVPREGRRENG